MKNNKKLVIIFAIINVLLIAVCGYFYFSKDRTAPKVTFSENDACFYEGISDEELLAGVSALDKKDGDVSGKIVIEKIVENEDTDRAIVYYAVSDLSGNVAKASREFPANYSEDKSVAGIEEIVGMESVEATPEPTAKPTEEPTPSPEAEETPVPTVTPTMRPTPVPTQRPTAPPTPTLEPTSTPKRDTPNPYMELNREIIGLNKGESIPWNSVIRTMVDDKDSYAVLYNNMVIGKYDTSQEGQFPVTVYTKDSDGNKSNLCAIVIIVQ